MVVAGNQVGSKVGGEKLFTACVDILFTVCYLGAFMWTSGTDSHSNMSLIYCLFVSAGVGYSAVRAEDTGSRRYWQQCLGLGSRVTDGSLVPRPLRYSYHKY